MQSQQYGFEYSEAARLVPFGSVLLALFLLFVALAISVAICLLLQTYYKRVPQEHRIMEPALVWLLLIPCFNFVWNFFVFPRLAQSFKSYFDQRGALDVGDCGYGLALAYSIVSCFMIIPCINYIAAPAALVLLIIVLVKFNNLSNRIVMGT